MKPGDVWPMFPVLLCVCIVTAVTSDAILKCFHDLRSAESQCLPHASDFLLVCKSSTTEATEYDDQIPVLHVVTPLGEQKQPSGRSL